MESIVILVFAVVGVIILVAIGRAITQAISNSQQPIASVTAQIVAKRTEVSGGMNNTSTSTSYYLTFEISDTGERQEFSVSGKEFGLLAEGDQGTLSRQGTWYKGFRRAPRVSMR